MTIEELNKLIKEELDAYLGEDDDIEVTTDEPGVETGEEALDILRQIFDLIKPTVEPEGGEEEAPEVGDEPADEEPPADEEEPAEEEEGDPEPEEEDLEEGTIAEDLAGAYNPAPVDGLTGALLMVLVFAGLPLVAYATATADERAEIKQHVRDNIKDYTALARLKGDQLRTQAKVLAAKFKDQLTAIVKEGDVEENLDRPNYKASDVKDATFKAEKIKGGLNESVDMSARFKKLANIK